MQEIKACEMCAAPVRPFEDFCGVDCWEYWHDLNSDFRAGDLVVLHQYPDQQFRVTDPADESGLMAVQSTVQPLGTAVFPHEAVRGVTLVKFVR